MAYNTIAGLPPQQLSFSRKNKKWRRECMCKDLDTSNKVDSTRKYDNHVFLVYMHVNKLNNKVYVGITHHINPNKRWGYSGEKYVNSTIFKRAIDKYGWNNFDHIVLCRTSKDRAIILERTLIAYYKKLGISYNIAEGGEGTESVSELTRQKMKERMRENHPWKGRHHTLESRKKISEANRKRVYTEEQKKQLSLVAESGRETMRKRGWWIPEESRRSIMEKLSKPVLQLDMEGNVLREFSSTKEADRFVNNGKMCGHIADVCNGKRKTANGYKWIYKEERRSN